MGRNEELARALGRIKVSFPSGPTKVYRLETGGGKGFWFSQDSAKFTEWIKSLEAQARIRQRVRELCTNPEVEGGYGIKLEYYGDYSECELYEVDTCKDVLRWDGNMKDEQKKFWEEALLLLAEKGKIENG